MYRGPTMRHFPIWVVVGLLALGAGATALAQKSSGSRTKGHGSSGRRSSSVRHVKTSRGPSTKTSARKRLTGTKTGTDKGGKTSKTGKGGKGKGGKGKGNGAK